MICNNGQAAPKNTHHWVYPVASQMQQEIKQFTYVLHGVIAIASVVVYDGGAEYPRTV